MDSETKQLLDANVASFYETHGAAFASTRRNTWNIMDLLPGKLKAGDLLVDVGAGNARLLYALPKEIRYLGLEPSAALREAADKIIASRDNAEIRAGGFPNLDLPDGCADTIACIAVIHHIASKQARNQALAELHRILKPGGTLVITTWNMRAKRFFGWDTFKSAWLRLPNFKGGDRGDMYYKWQKHKQERYVHAYALKEWRAQFDKNLWHIETIGAYDVGGWSPWWTGRNLAAIVTKK